jgi:hypothetical protein
MPTSLPKRHDTRPREQSVTRGVSIFVVAVVVGFVVWCVADHVEQPSSPLASYASSPPTNQNAAR